ncbi:MAG: Cardiolipin synthase A [Chlamydiae bacterium]|nr:Cardiolipin synthase A [Chlamydiota bacterium]
MPRNPYSLSFYSNQERSDLKRTLLDAFSKAQDQILVSVYSMTDPDIIKKINEKAKSGVNVSIFIDKKHLKSLAKKMDSNVLVQKKKQRGLMHEKIFLIDDLIFIGSSNLTTTSLRMHDNLMVGYIHRELTNRLRNYYSNDAPFIFWDPTCGIHFFCLPSPEALAHILTHIKQASKQIDIALFTFTHPKILKALIEANQRGVKVRVLLDYLSTLGASRFVAARLKEEHIAVYHNRGLQLMHHKMALIDQKIFILGSTNWTRSAFERNQDDLIIFSQLEKRQLKKVIKIFQHLFWESEKND